MENEQKLKTTSESGFRPERCPDCGSTSKIQKHELRATKKGKKQRWRCNDCGATFYGDLQ